MSLAGRGSNCHPAGPDAKLIEDCLDRAEHLGGSGLNGPMQRLMHIVCAPAPLHCAFDEIKMVDYFSRLAMHIDQMTL